MLPGETLAAACRAFGDTAARTNALVTSLARPHVEPAAAARTVVPARRARALRPARVPRTRRARSPSTPGHADIIRESLDGQKTMRPTAYDRRVTTTTDGRHPRRSPSSCWATGATSPPSGASSVPGDLPAPSDPDLVARARAAKAALGDRVFVLGHHYQRDEVIEFADVTGDSFKLAKEAAARPDAEYVVFCGVHFMAESADILTADSQTVVLPDLAAGCSMADMAAIDQVEECWDELVEAGVADATVPVTYMNSSAAIKAFTGRHGGTVCTSSNARTALTWALGRAGEGGKVLFLPDQHLGRNTYVRDLGGPLEDCVVWDPHRPMGGLTPEQLRDATMILWRGHCSVHGRFSVEAVEAARRDIPDVRVIVHPECRHEVVELADEVGSTERIIRTIAAAPPGRRGPWGPSSTSFAGSRPSSPSSGSPSSRRTSATARR